MKTIKLNKEEKAEVQCLIDEIFGQKNLLSDLSKRRTEINDRLMVIIKIPFNIRFNDKTGKISSIVKT